MVTKTTKIIVEGKCAVGDDVIAHFFATIANADPENINFSTRYIDKNACKEHRDVVRADEAEFEDYVYSIQDDMLSKLETQ